MNRWVDYDMRLNPEKNKHYLKTWPEYFKAVKQNKKKFEIRLNDRNFQTGDILVLQEYNPDSQSYTGSNNIVALVTYILDKQPFVPEEYVCMSIMVLNNG